MFNAQIKLGVLKSLNRKNHNGYELINGLSQTFGKKPSPGYIYPLLKDLKERGFVTEAKSGNKNIYSITKDGKYFLDGLLKKREESMKLMLQAVEPLADKKEIKMFKDFMEKIKDEKSPFNEQDGLFEEFRREAWKAMSDKNKKENFRAIMKNTIKQLKKLNAK